MLSDSKVSLEEIERFWSYEDIMKFNALMDMREDHESYANYIQNKKIK